MAGSVFAACIDSPAETVEKGDKTYKQYFGSASAINKGKNVHVEGRLVSLECNGFTYNQKLNEMTESLQSSMSYAGGDIRLADWGVIYQRR